MPIDAKDAQKVSRREAIAAAFDKSPTETEEEAPVEAAAEEVEPAAEAEGEDAAAEGAEGEGTAEEKAAAGEKTEGDAKTVKPGNEKDKGDKSKEKTAAKGEKPGEKAKGEAAKAPASWKPGAREAWAKLPADVQAEVARREKEFAGKVQQLNQAQQWIKPVADVLRPYEGPAKAMGINPLKLIDESLQLASGLRAGDESHKGTLLATLMQRFKVPVDAVNNALVKMGLVQADEPVEEEDAAEKSAKGAKEPQFDPAKFRDPRVDDLLKQRESETAQRQAAQAQREAQMQAEVQKEISEFADEHEFYDDVRPMMKRLMAGAAAEKEEMSLQEAYETAVAANADVQKILRQREDADRIKGKQAAAAKAKQAGSSIKSSPAGGGTEAKPTGIRASVEQAWAKFDRG